MGGVVKTGQICSVLFLFLYGGGLHAQGVDENQAQSIEKLRSEIKELKLLHQKDLKNQQEKIKKQSKAIVDLGVELNAQKAKIDNGATEESISEIKSELEEFSNSIWEEISGRNLLAGYATVLFDKQKTGASGDLVDHDSKFRFVKMNLLLNGQVSPKLRFFGELEFERPADIPSSGGGHIKGEQGYIDFVINDLVALRAGAVLVPFGYYNLMHEEWRFAIYGRPMVSQLVFPSTYTDVGLLLFGTLYRGEQTTITYEAGVINGLDADFVSNINGKGLRSGRPIFEGDSNDDKSFVGRFALGYTEHFEVGLSGYWGVYSDELTNEDAGAINLNGDQALTIIGLDAELEFDNLRWRAETISVLVGSDGGKLSLDDDGDDATPAIDLKMPSLIAGGETELELLFFPDLLKGTWMSDFENPKLFAAARLEYATRRYEDDPTESETIITAGVGYRPVYRSAFRLQFAKGFGDLELQDGWNASAVFSLGY